MHRIIRVVLVLFLGLAGTAAAQEAMSQRDASGPVAVTVTLLEHPIAGAPIRAKVALDTHSVGLDGIRFGTVAAVRNADGSDQPPVAAEQVSGGGHHRQAVLVFPAFSGAAPLTIVVKDVGGVAVRKFTWDAHAQ